MPTCKTYRKSSTKHSKTRGKRNGKTWDEIDASKRRKHQKTTTLRDALKGWLPLTTARKDPFHYHWVVFWGVPMVLHHCMSYSSPCSFKEPCHCHSGWGGWVLGGPDGSSSLHVIFFPVFFQRSMSLPFRVEGSFLLGVVPLVALGVRVSYHVPIMILMLMLLLLLLLMMMMMMLMMMMVMLMMMMMMMMVMLVLMMMMMMMLLLMMMMMMMMMMMFNVADPRCDSGQTMAWNHNITSSRNYQL